jgi:hypothetical protein
LSHDAGRVQAVAYNVADGDRDAAAGQVDQVVPVASHVQCFGSGPVTYGRRVATDRAGSGQHGFLQGQRDFTGADEFRDVLHPVQQQRHPTIRSEYGNVGHVEVPLVPYPGLVGVLQVVALQRYDAALTGVHSPAQ